MDEARELEAGHRRDGYELLDRLGTGGQAQVWRARRTADGAVVALKFLAPGVPSAAVARFQREATILEQLDHPNIVRFLGFGLWGTRPYLALEYVAGRSLFDALNTGGADGDPLSPGDILAVTGDLLAAIHYLERLSLFHRDIKPANVLLDERGTARLADFGLARFREMTRLTSDDLTVGTISYMAPEMLFDGEGSTASDIYQVGLVLYEMLYGDLPFPDSTGYARAVHRCSNSLTVPELAPERGGAELASVVARACELDPAARWPSAAAMLAALSAVARRIDGAPVAPRLSEPPPALVARAAAVGGTEQGTFVDELLLWLPWFAFAAGMALGTTVLLCMR